MLCRSKNYINKRDYWVPCSLPTEYELKHFSLKHFVIIVQLLNWGRTMARLDARNKEKREMLFRIVQLLFGEALVFSYS